MITRGIETQLLQKDSKRDAGEGQSSSNNIDDIEMLGGFHFDSPNLSRREPLDCRYGNTADS